MERWRPRAALRECGRDGRVRDRATDCDGNCTNHCDSNRDSERDSDRARDPAKFVRAAAAKKGRAYGPHVKAGAGGKRYTNASRNGGNRDIRNCSARASLNFRLDAPLDARLNARLNTRFNTGGAGGSVWFRDGF